MEKYFNQIICGEALTELRKMPDEFVDMIITSPPYYGLRNYGVDGQLGLEPTFEEFINKFLEITAELKRVLKKTGSFWLNFGDSYGGQPAGNKSISDANIGNDGVFVRKMKQGQGAKSFVESTDNDRMFGTGVSGRLKQTAMQKCLLMQPERIAIKMIDDDGDDIYELRKDLTEKDLTELQGLI